MSRRKPHHSHQHGRNKRKNSTDEEKTVAYLANMVHKYRKKASETTAIQSWRRMRNYFMAIWMIRCFTAFFVTTEFVPDEGWQSTEVAYYYTYGRGHLTWEWLVGLRNHIYPFCIATIYHLLRLFKLDTPYALIIMPRLFQATITAIGDFSFFVYCIKRYGHDSAKWSLALFISNWFTLYCGARTITNTTEMALNCVAMYLLETENAVALVGVVAVNFLIRPTALVVWIPQVLEILALFYPQKVPYRFLGALFVGSLTLTIGTVIDSIVYGKPVVAALRFIKFNFLEGQSAQFGEHHVLWYFYSGLPSIIGPLVVPLVYAFKVPKYRNQCIIILTFLSCFSLIQHKEIRFILPVLPYIFEVVGDLMKNYELGLKISKARKEGENYEQHMLRRTISRGTMLFICTNVFALIYFGTFHQGAVLPATEFINKNSRNISSPEIWVMMQCYSVPVFTYMHNPNASFQYMTCGPCNMELETVHLNFRRYSTDPAEIHQFISEKVNSSVPFPHFVMCFEEITAKLVKAFKEFGEEYYVCLSHLHAQFGEDRGVINVLCKNGLKLPFPSKLAMRSPVEEQSSNQF